MAEQKWMTKTVCFPVFLLACFSVGWMIPTFYDWSGADQSCSTAAMDQMLWSPIVFGCLAWLVLPWLPMEYGPTETDFAKEVPTESNSQWFQFNLYSVLLATAVAAILIAVIANESVVLCILIWVVVFVAAVSMIVKHLGWQRQLSALLACMYLPYAWVLNAKLFGKLSLELVMGALALPSFLPAVVVGRLFGTRAEEIVWLWVLLIAVEIAIGFWAIRKSPKFTIAYFVLVMLMSIYGSMFLNMGSRI